MPALGSGEAVACRVRVGGVEDRICVLPTPEARPPEGFGDAAHRIQLANGAFDEALLFDLEEAGHDQPREAPVPPEEDP